MAGDRNVILAGHPSGAHVAGVRLHGSPSVSFFLVDDGSIMPGTWVVARAPGGEQAGCVVIGPAQVLLSQLRDELAEIERVMSEDEIARMDHFQRESSIAARRAREIARRNDLPIDQVIAEYSWDGSRLLVSYSSNDPDGVACLEKALREEFSVAVEMRTTDAREKVRLVGGLGSSRRQPSGISRENDLYREAKQQLPQLGQHVTTREGDGTVIALQIFRELATVRYGRTGREVTYQTAELLHRGLTRSESG